jgi:uncharacterized protein (TIGR03437 family)
MDSAGNTYFSSLNCVFRLDTNGLLSRVAGDSRAGYSGDGGPATSAQLNNPIGVAVDASGDIYVADSGNNRIREISAKGVITTVSGNGSGGYSGDGGPASGAQLSFPAGVAVDAEGNIYIADEYNNRVRKVSANGTIVTVAGNGALDSSGFSGFSGDGGPATSAQLNNPVGVAVDASGSLYIADSQNSRIRKVSATGSITTVAGNGSSGHSGDGGPATSAQIGWPFGVAVDAGGNIYFADWLNGLIRKVSAAGIITTVAGTNGPAGPYPGDGGPATGVYLQVYGVAVDAGGNLYISDQCRVRKVSIAGVITTVAGNGSSGTSGDGGPAPSAQISYPAGVAVDAGGNLYIAEGGNGLGGDAVIRRVSVAGIITTVAGNGRAGYSGDGGPATSAKLNGPTGVAFDGSGNMYIADSSNSVVREVFAATGIITTVAGNGSFGYSGDGGPATSAQLDGAWGVAVDDDGNIYIADLVNDRIRRVSGAGTITTVAGGGSSGLGDGGPATGAQLSGPNGVAVDADGNLYIADTGHGLIRKVSAAGTITTVAGGGPYGLLGDWGLATSAWLDDPWGVAIDGSGNVYIADYGHALVRKVSALGIITTVAGDGHDGYAGDGGPATDAQISLPQGVAVDASGNVYIADPGNDAVRLLTPVGSACTYSFSPTSLQLPAAVETGQDFTLTVSTASGCPWGVADLPDWITVSGSSAGIGPSTVTLAVDENSGPPRSAEIYVAGVPVSVNQASYLLLVSAGGVVSAASYGAAVAPGSIAAVFGNFLVTSSVSASSFPIPTMLGGLSLQFGNPPQVILAPLFYAGGEQANAQIPWEMASQAQTTTVAANNNGQTSTPQTVTLATYAPGIFATNGTGAGQGAILDGNYRLVDSSNPATAGSTVLQIFCTGLGPVTNQPATGAPSPSDPLSRTTVQPTVMIGGTSAEVLFSGLAPGDVGLYQVDALVPDGAAVGSAVPVVITIGWAQSNVVTIAVK